MNMLLRIKKIFDKLTTLCVVLSVLLAIALVGVRVIGWEPYTVLSGSMEPTYHVGSLIYVKKVEAAELKVGDPLTYRVPSGTIVTHRIIELVPGKADPTVTCFRTQGDANDIADGAAVLPEQIIGKPVFTLPYLGYVSHFIQHPPGTYVVISAFLLLLLMPNFLDALSSVAEKKQDEPAEN